jgi:ABC-type multidrug transport system fused ATPase/permease subunit
MMRMLFFFNKALPRKNNWHWTTLQFSSFLATVRGSYLIWPPFECYKTLYSILPDLLSVIVQGKVSANIITSYLQEDEIQKDAIVYVPKDQTEFDIEIDSGKFSWDPDSSNPTLEGMKLKVKRGMKVAICGTVGSGKSSLLSCMLGEIQKLSGTVKISGTKAYVSQSPWILTGNIRENILFGNLFDSAKYNRTVKACALTKDFELFSCGNLTEIDERG